MQAYIDDSGKGDPPVFLLAGFVARAEEWVILSQRWSDAVHRRAGLRYFKMKEAQALDEQFRGWSARRRNGLLCDLVSIIKDHVLVSVASVVYQRDYRKTIQGNLSKEVDDPYWLIYHSIMNLVFQWEIQSGLSEEVDFIFDEQFKQGDEVQAAWRHFYDLAPPEIKSLFGGRPTHRDDKKS